jgi:WD40 repeat protein
MTLRLFIGVVALSLIILQGCTNEQPKTSIKHTEGNAIDASISYSGKYSVISSINHGVVVWNNDKNGVLYNWYQTPEFQSFSVEGADAQQVEADTNFVLATAISTDETHALLANKHAFSLWDLQTGQNKGYWQLKQETVEYTNVQKTSYKVIDSNQCSEANLSSNQGCEITNHIRVVAVSKAGKHVVLGKSNGTALFINLTTGRRLEFLGHQQIYSIEDDTFHINNAINSIDISPNGKYVLTGSSDKSALLWDTQTGQVIYKFQHLARVTKVLLDSKARYAFTADSKNTATIWDLKTGKAESTLNITQRQQIFTAASFNSEATLLVTGSPNRLVSIWDVETGKLRQHWYVSENPNGITPGGVVLSARFIDNAQKVMTESSTGLNEVWNVNHE